MNLQLKKGIDHMDKECKILGYHEVTIKETGEVMYRICISLKSKKDKYVGNESLYVFLPINDELKETLNYAIENECIAHYTTTDNIITGKTKVSNITI